MMEDITIMCSPPDPKTQPKITAFLRPLAENTRDKDCNANQTRITSFFQKSPCAKTGRKRPSSVTDPTGAAGKNNGDPLSLRTTSEEKTSPSKCIAAEDNVILQPKMKRLIEMSESIRQALENSSQKKTSCLPKGENEPIKKRPVGRPRKILPADSVTKAVSANSVVAVKRPVGRPRKTALSAQGNAQVSDVSEVSSLQVTTPLIGCQGSKEKRPVGRPRKTLTPKIKTPSTKPIGKQSRTCYSVEKKQEVVEYAQQHSIYKASLHYNLSCGTIGPWMKKDFSKIKANYRRSSGGGRKLSYPPEIEAELAEWILVQRDIQPNLSNQDIVTHACTLIQPSCPSFRGTSGWLHKFMVRNNLLFIYDAPLVYTLPAPLEENISTFLELVRRDRNEYNYPKELVGNMDEVSVAINMASNRKAEKSKTMIFPTYTVGGEKKSYTVGTEKQHITVVLTALSNGDLLPPMIVFRGSKTPKNVRTPE